MASKLPNKTHSLIIRKQPEDLAVISKGVETPNKRYTFDQMGSNDFVALQGKISQRNRENKNVLDLFPEFELARQIIISSILSPKDLFSRDLIFKVTDSIFTSTLQQQLVEIVQRQILTVYKLDSRLESILSKAMFTQGSYASLVVPESSLDQIINEPLYAAESASAVSRRIDEKVKTMSLESHGFLESGKSSSQLFADDGVPGEYDPYVEVTDNWEVLKLSKLKDKKLEALARSSTYRYRSATESFNQTAAPLSAAFQTNKLFRPVDGKLQQVLPVPETGKRRSLTRPLYTEVPSDCVIPIYHPGLPEEHVGYFILVDENGHWVSSNQDAAELVGDSNTTKTNTFSEYLTNKARGILLSPAMNTKTPYNLEVYEKIVETMLVKHLKKEVFGSELQIADYSNWYRLMLSRVLQKKKTRVLFVHRSMLTYYAYDYHPNGVGRSYLDRIRTLASFLALLQVSRVLGTIKNNIDVTTINIEFSENDPDPLKTIETVLNDALKARQFSMPIGITSVNDAVNWAQRAGIRLQFGNHPGIPNTKLSMTSEKSEHHVPDADIIKEIKDQCFQAMQINPELINLSNQPEFASIATQNNALQTQRFNMLSDRTSEFLTRDVVNIVRNDPVIMQELFDAVSTAIQKASEPIYRQLSPEDSETLKQNPTALINQKIFEFIESLWIDLPKPEVKAVETQDQIFKNLSDGLTEALKPYFVFDPATQPKLAQNAERLQSLVHAALLRRSISEEGFFPLVQTLFVKNEKGTLLSTLKDELSSHERFISDLLGGLSIEDPTSPDPSKEPEGSGSTDTLNAPDVDENEVLEIPEEKPTENEDLKEKEPKEDKKEDKASEEDKPS